MAVARGVDVRLIVSGDSDVPIPLGHAATQLARSGVRVYRMYGERLIHAKTMLVDDAWALIGSFNWDPVSAVNLELGVSLCDPERVAQLEEQWHRDLADCKPLHIYPENELKNWWGAFVYRVSRIYPTR